MYLTTKEQLRIEILSKYIDGNINREHAQISLEVGERQFRRIVKRFKQNGFLSIRHGNHGKIPKNKISKELENKISSLAKIKYSGFNMTHFFEKLLKENLEMPIPSYSTIRRVLTEKKIYKPKKRRSKRPHRSRNRYEREGIMVQIDGSHHIWFGSQKSCLIVAIDDATGKIVGAKFSKTETTLDTMDVIEQVLFNHGTFQILYSDRAGIYDNHKREGFTNVTRAMKKLGICTILAYSAEAKGRVERLNRTLQDRLISELRLRGIDTMEEANAFLLGEFLEYFNKLFSVLPVNPESAFKKLPAEININEIMCMVEERSIGCGLNISLDNQKYVVKWHPNTPIRGKRVEVRTYRNGIKKFFIEDEEIQVEKLEKYKRAA